MNNPVAPAGINEISDSGFSAFARPRAAVVIGCYDNASYIIDAIESVRNQSSCSWICIIIDNSSSDGSWEIIARVIHDDPKFKLVSKGNEGPGSWRNYGASLVPDSVDYLHFLDGDDALEPTFLQTSINYLDQNPRVGLLSLQYNIIDEKGALVCPGFRSRYAPSSFGFPAPIPDSSVETPFVSFFSATGQGPFCVFRKSVFDQTDGYEVKFWSHEDSDICCQMALLAECHQLPDRLYNKRTHSTNLTYSPRADYSKFRDKWDCFKARNPSEAKILDHALRYYYTRHMPMRDLKVSLKALREFLATASYGKFKFALHLLNHGLLNLIFHPEYHRVLSLRDRPARFALPSSCPSP
ncbi:MAG: glycosyltransferase [Prochlorococcaceae cyanobacterium]